MRSGVEGLNEKGITLWRAVMRDLFQANLFQHKPIHRYTMWARRKKTNFMNYTAVHERLKSDVETQRLRGKCGIYSEEMIKKRLLMRIECSRKFYRQDAGRGEEK